MCSDSRKNHGCGQKKPEGTSSAIFVVGTAAKCCEPKRCAGRVRCRTDNKDKVHEGKFRNLNFSPSTKKTTEYSFELFLSIYRYLIFFLKFKTSTLEQSFCCTGCPKAPGDFPPRKDDILLPRSGCPGTTLTLPRSLYGRTDGRAYADVRTNIAVH